MSVSIEAALRSASQALSGFEIVPGVQIAGPRLGPAWNQGDVIALRELAGSLPNAFETLMLTLGSIQAIEAGGGFSSMSLEAIKHELTLQYGAALRHLQIDTSTIDVLPIGTNSSGSYFLLACDNSGVWKFNVHMRAIAPPVKIADSVEEFFMRIADDWRAMASGRGSPYMTD